MYKNSSKKAQGRQHQQFQFTPKEEQTEKRIVDYNVLFVSNSYFARVFVVSGRCYGNQTSTALEFRAKDLQNLILN
jgi:hypothetical protein